MAKVPTKQAAAKAANLRIRTVEKKWLRANMAPHWRDRFSILQTLYRIMRSGFHPLQSERTGQDSGRPGVAMGLGRITHGSGRHGQVIPIESMSSERNGDVTAGNSPRAAVVSDRSHALPCILGAILGR